MYDEHYGFSGRPFQLTPDPRFWFETASHKKAMAYLGYGLSQGEGFIVITGDPGAGKTTLLGHLLETVDAQRLHVVKMASTQIEPDDLLRIVAGQYDVATHGLTKSELLGAIEKALHVTARAGKRSLLVVDEAQALPVASLEELRMLSNLQAGGHALMQIFLLGQPEFRERLQGSQGLEQLRQRVIAMHHLEPMGESEVEPYLQHRMSLVGWRGRPRFTQDAIAALHAASRGYPRELNKLAARVLLYGAMEQLEGIDGSAVDVVTEDLARDLPQLATRATVPARAPVPEIEPLPAVWEPVEDEAPAAAFDEDGVFADDGAHDADDAILAERVAALEAHVEAQDEALRRVLTLLVACVEADNSHDDIASLRPRAA